MFRFAIQLTRVSSKYFTRLLKSRSNAFLLSHISDCSEYNDRDEVKGEGLSGSAPGLGGDDSAIGFLMQSRAIS